MDILFSNTITILRLIITCIFSQKLFTLHIFHKFYKCSLFNPSPLHHHVAIVPFFKEKSKAFFIYGGNSSPCTFSLFYIYFRIIKNLYFLIIYIFQIRMTLEMSRSRVLSILCSFVLMVSITYSNFHS